MGDFCRNTTASASISAKTWWKFRSQTIFPPLTTNITTSNFNIVTQITNSQGWVYAIYFIPGIIKITCVSKSAGKLHTLSRTITGARQSTYRGKAPLHQLGSWVAEEVNNFVLTILKLLFIALLFSLILSDMRGNIEHKCHTSSVSNEWE